jgi:hypothetical protein
VHVSVTPHGYPADGSSFVARTPAPTAKPLVAAFAGGKGKSEDAAMGDETPPGTVRICGGAH